MLSSTIFNSNEVGLPSRKFSSSEKSRSVLTSLNLSGIQQQGFDAVMKYLSMSLSSLSSSLTDNLTKLIDPDTTALDGTYVDSNGIMYTYNNILQAVKNYVNGTASTVVKSTTGEHGTPVTRILSAIKSSSSIDDVLSEVTSRCISLQSKISDVTSLINSRLNESDIKGSSIISSILALKPTATLASAGYTILQWFQSLGRTTISATGDKVVTSVQGLGIGDTAAFQLLGNFLWSSLSAAAVLVVSTFSVLASAAVYAAKAIVELVPNILNLINGGGNMFTQNANPDMDAFSLPIAGGVIRSSVHNSIYDPSLFTTPVDITYYGATVFAYADENGDIQWRMRMRRFPHVYDYFSGGKFVKTTSRLLYTGTTTWFNAVDTECVLPWLGIYYRQITDDYQLLTDDAVTRAHRFDESFFNYDDVFKAMPQTRGDGGMSIYVDGWPWALNNYFSSTGKWTTEITNNTKDRMNPFAKTDPMPTFKDVFVFRLPLTPEEDASAGATNSYLINSSDPEENSGTSYMDLRMCIGYTLLRYMYEFTPSYSGGVWFPSYYVSDDDAGNTSITWRDGHTMGAIGFDSPLTVPYILNGTTVTSKVSPDSVKDEICRITGSLGSPSNMAADGSLTGSQIGNVYAGFTEPDVEPTLASLALKMILLAQEEWLRNVDSATGVISVPAHPYVLVSASDLSLVSDNQYSLCLASDTSRWLTAAAAVATGAAAIVSATILTAKFIGKRVAYKARAKIEDRYWTTYGDDTVSASSKAKLMRKYDFIYNITSPLIDGSASSGESDDAASDTLNRIVNLITGE